MDYKLIKIKMKKIIILLVLLCSNVIADDFKFIDMTKSNNLRCCDNETCYDLNNTNVLNNVSLRYCYEYNQADGFKPVDFFKDNLMPLITVFAVIGLGLSIWQLRKK